ncbi:MAG: circularly permuted ATPgrasp family protein, partial [Variovorax sp.]|nr:circularly permuted ATPgrasp family protein [Variovorax sp.]
MVDPLNESLFDAQATESSAALASLLAPPSTPGHYDELRGAAVAATPPKPASAASAAPGAVLYDASQQPPPVAAPLPSGPTVPRPELAPPWRRFFDHLGTGGFNDLPRRAV